MEAFAGQLVRLWELQKAYQIAKISGKGSSSRILMKYRIRAAHILQWEYRLTGRSVFFA